MAQPPALRPLEEMIERWKKATVNLADGVKDSPSFDLKRMIKERCEAITICADELASALPELERLLRERVVAAEEAATKTICKDVEDMRLFIVSVPQWAQTHSNPSDVENLRSHVATLVKLCHEKNQGALARHDRELTKRILTDARRHFDIGDFGSWIRVALGGSECD